MSNKNIFKIFALIGVLTGIFSITACTDYKDDINAVNRRVDDLEKRVKALEDLMKRANENITSIQEIVDNISYDGYVANITKIENGYEMVFGDGTKVIVHDGEDGVVPAISVKQDTDGNWYWTLDGEWMLDDSGNKVRANGEKGEDGTTANAGKDGVTPQLRINETSNEWEVSYDEGKNWKSLGVKATGEKGESGTNGTNGKDGTNGTNGTDGKDGDSFFKSVTVGTDEVTFVLTDNTTFKLPLYDNFSKVRDRLQSMTYIPDYIDGKIGVGNDKTMTLRYQVKPAAVATYLAAHQDAMKFVGEDVMTTRGAAATAKITITDAKHAGDGILELQVKTTGFVAEAGYAFALDVEAESSSFRTAYTPAFLIVEPDQIAIGVNGLYPGMGTVTAGKYLQLFVVFFPDYTTSRDITWKSNDESRAKVNKSGIVAVADNAPDGEFSITAKATNGKEATLTLSIVDKKLQIDTTQLIQSMAQ